MHISRKYVSLILTIAIVYTGYGFACGSGGILVALKVALASSTPLVNSLVAAGVLPQDKATKIVQDFSDGTQCAITLNDDFKAIPSDAADKRAQKFAAANKAQQCFRVIVNRQNFAANPKVQNAANIADGIFATIVAFYSGRPAVVRSDKVLEDDLKEQIEELKAALRVN